MKQAGETLAQKMDGDALNELGNEAAENEEDNAPAHVAAVLAAGEVRSIEDIRTAVENALGEVHAMGGLAGKTAEQIESIRVKIETVLKTAALRANLPQELAQVEEGEILQATQEAAGKAVGAVYEGGNENVQTALNELAENAAGEAVEELAFQQAVDAAENRVQIREQGVEIGEGVQYSLRKTEGMSWEEQVDDVISRQMPGNATLNLQNSNIVSDFGLPEIVVGMNIGDMRKVMREQRGSKSGHALDGTVVKAFQNEINAPVAAFENAESGTLYVLTHQLDKDGYPVVMVIKENQQDGDNTPMHQVKSAYGMKDVLGYMAEHLPEGSKYAVYDRKTLNQIVSPTAQRTMTGTDTKRFDKRFTEIVAREKDKVKEYVVFSPDQINSATDNIGLFDPQNPDIRYSQRKKKTVDRSEEEGYNGTRWATDTGALSTREAARFLSNIGNRQKGDKYPQDSEGHSIIPVKDDENGPSNVLVVAGGDYVNPTVERVYRVNVETETEMDYYRRLILNAEGESHYQAWRTVLSSDRKGLVEVYGREGSSRHFGQLQRQRPLGATGEDGGETAGDGGRGALGTGHAGHAGRGGDVSYSQRRATAPSFRQAMMDMPITGDMTALEKELLTKYKSYVQEYNEKQEQINAQAEIISAEAEKKENADKDAVTKANNRMQVLKVQQRRVEEKLYQASLPVQGACGENMGHGIGFEDGHLSLFSSLNCA